MPKETLYDQNQQYSVPLSEIHRPDHVSTSTCRAVRRSLRNVASKFVHGMYAFGGNANISLGKALCS